jgi:hypothetical protein
MLARQTHPAQDFMGHARSPTAESDGSLSFRLSIEVQGLGPWRGLGQRPNLALLQRSIIQMPRRTQPQHQSREAGSCMGAQRTLFQYLLHVGFHPKRPKAHYVIVIAA